MRVALSALLLIGATSAAAAPAPQESWGKAGVTYDQYRLDAVECSSEGYNLDISQTEDAKAFVRASRQLETEIGSGLDPYTYQSIVKNARPGMRYRSIKNLQQSTVDHCLANRGYRKFRLNAQQRDGLQKLKVGSLERHMYLYRLGTDSNVVGTQAVSSAPAR